MIHTLIEHIAVKTVSETSNEGVFEIEGLYAGYGITLGNALRRILLSSLPGAAITQAKIKGVGHKFTTIPGVLEDVVELTLNIKKIRFVMTSDEPQVLHLKSKGEGEVRAGDFETGPQVRVITPDQKIATLTDKKAEFDLEVTVEKGVGYSPVESRSREAVPIGVLLIDALFAPVHHIDFKVEDMRVGDRIDYNRVRITIRTDGTMTPSTALKDAVAVLGEHASTIGSKIEARPFEIAASAGEEKPKKKSKKSTRSEDEDKEVS